MSTKAEILELAVKLEAIAQWQMDQVANETRTGALLMDSARNLRELADAKCDQGIIGCYRKNCTCDHK